MGLASSGREQQEPRGRVFSRGGTSHEHEITLPSWSCDLSGQDRVAALTEHLSLMLSGHHYPVYLLPSIEQMAEQLSCSHLEIYDALQQLHSHGYEYGLIGTYHPIRIWRQET